MVYVEGGRVVGERSKWRLSIIPEIFFGVLNFVVFFFRTMIDPTLKPAGARGGNTGPRINTLGGGSGGGGGGGGGSGGGGRRRGNGGAPPNVRGMGGRPRGAAQAPPMGGG
mmetsp:Transcript_13340/g.40016  ORF Transcript_13340/g.40016 Transcript_13340/m.40016 type:complete len:111 (+) Transcript_13340:2-334(+)